MLDVDKEVLVSRSIRKMLFRNQSFQRSHDLPSLKWGGRDDEKERQERGRTNHSYASVTIATVKHSPMFQRASRTGAVRDPRSSSISECGSSWG